MAHFSFSEGLRTSASSAEACFFKRVEPIIVPRKLTCPLKINVWKMYFLLTQSLFWGHVSFQGCIEDYRRVDLILTLEFFCVYTFKYRFFSHAMARFLFKTREKQVVQGNTSKCSPWLFLLKWRLLIGDGGAWFKRLEVNISRWTKMLLGESKPWPQRALNLRKRLFCTKRNNSYMYSPSNHRGSRDVFMKMDPSETCMNVGGERSTQSNAPYGEASQFQHRKGT